MSSQRISLGVRPLGGGNTPWSGSEPVNAALIAGGGAAFLRHVAQVGGHAQIRLSATPAGEPTDAGPRFTPALETYLEAFLFEGAGEPITLGGPDSAGASHPDPTEPYFWTPTNSAEWLTWATSQTTDAEVFLTLDDGVLAEAVEVEPEGISAGEPTLTASLTIFNPYVALEPEGISAGLPGLTASLEILETEVAIQPAGIAAGNPTLTARLVISDDLVIVRPAGVSAGIPSLTARVVIPEETVSLQPAGIAAGNPTLTARVAVLVTAFVDLSTLPLRVAWAIRIPEFGWRVWSGVEQVTVGGEVWTGAGHILDLDAAEVQIGEPVQRLSLRLALVNRALRDLVLQDLGPLRIEVHWWRYSQDGGWTVLRRRIIGRLSQGGLQGGFWSAEVEATPYLPGRAVRWSHEDQQTRYPGDRGMELLGSIASGARVAWPPAPRDRSGGGGGDAGTPGELPDEIPIA